MAVTCLRIIRITEGAMGACVMHLEDGSEITKSPDWALQHKPQVHGYIIDNGKPDGENWYAACSAGPLQAVLTEVQRVEAKPGELVVFKLPAHATDDVAMQVKRLIDKQAPGLPFLVVRGDVLDITVVSATQEAALAGAEVKA